MSYERKRAPDQPAANDPKYVVIELRARIAALEAIVGKQEEELHQGELRVAELEAKLKWAMGLNACIEHERAEQAEAELATKEKECQEQFRQLLGAGETFNKMNAELAALKCCGNCKWFRAEEYQYCGLPDIPGYHAGDHEYYISAPDECDFTPSRWTNS